jgi:DNA-binding MarR family transcriptional regulator
MTHRDVAAPSEARLEATNALAERLIKLLRLMKRAVVPAHMVGCPGFEKAAHMLVATLHYQGPLRAGALAEAIHSDPSTISRQVASLVRQGLIERRPDPLDGRASVLAVTTEGERVLQHYERVRDERLALALATWPEPELRQLTTMLERFNNDFEHSEPWFDGMTATAGQGEETQ